jgi:hypothetical protein
MAAFGRIKWLLSSRAVTERTVHLLTSPKPDRSPKAENRKGQSMKTNQQKSMHRTTCRIRRSMFNGILTLLLFSAFASTGAADPTFSDANWISMNPSIPGADDVVAAALVDREGNLYIGGRFNLVGDVIANGVAKWDGNRWSALESGMNDLVRALAVSGSNLYAGGWFTTAGGRPANHIAKWNGSSWSAVGAGMDDFVEALAVSGSNVYAGGRFTTAGGRPANHIATWDGSSWSALGSGMNGVVLALALSGSDLYAGGRFTTEGALAATNIARWNGSSWSALGSGMNDLDDLVMALAVSGSDLYAGGEFTTVTTSDGVAVTVNTIAKWNGSSWSALGSGMAGFIPLQNSARVDALAVSGNDLYAGGWFMTAGGKVSACIARAYLLPLPTLSVRRSGPSVTVSWPSADTADFTLEQAATLAAPASWVTNSASVTDDGTNKWVSVPATNPAQFFRLRRP